MKRFKHILLILILAVTSAGTYAQQGNDEQLTVPLSSPGKPYTLKVHLVQGSIKVTGYEGKDILITVSASQGEDEENDNENVKEKNLEGMKRLSSHGGYEVSAKELDNTVTINTSNPNKTVNLTLKVPQDVKLKVGTVNEGVLEIENIKGEVEANNVNDKIDLKDISGSVVANTVNGDVTVTFKAVDPSAPMAFSTLNGDIRVTLPADVKANLKMKSDNGEVYSGFDIDLDKTAPNITKSNENGVLKLTKDDWIKGKINGGGQELMLKTMQGDIFVKKGTR
ncbi:MAG TPA: DUF4097 family beta strand repeat-containing protein [Bacteroidales bacterium]|nr:DUF4097 family beta strand repeat-containing protein [Bacteroidales bacterium]